MVRFVLYAAGIIAVVFGGIFLFVSKNTIEISEPAADATTTESVEKAKEVAVKKEKPVLPKPLPLATPPSVVKAIYSTSWSAGSLARINYFIDLIHNTELNAVVIDIKDFSGFIGYDTAVPEAEEYKAEEVRITDLDSVVRKLHDKNIYVIARTTVFQDPRLALARPDLAVRNKKTGDVWRDRKGLMWVDPASKEVWDYNIKIIKDALAHGFDEINFDYVRFPSDGDLDALSYVFWDEVTPMRLVIRDFFRYLRKELPGVRISADIFGQTTVNYDDLGIGQLIEDVYESFDYVSPMVYPSHYLSSFLNLGNPAAYPYEVVKYSMESAISRLKNYKKMIENATTTELQPKTYNLQPKLRPWLQAFDLGAIYSPEMVRKQIQAVYDAASSTPELLNGFMLWNPSNVYDRRALLQE